jgi:hypothetical protein
MRGIILSGKHQGKDCELRPSLTLKNHFTAMFGDGTFDIVKSDQVRIEEDELTLSGQDVRLPIPIAAKMEIQINKKKGD